MTNIVISSGMTSSGLMLASSDTLTVLHGGTVISTILQDGSVEVLSGGAAHASVLSGATEMVFSGGRAIGTAVTGGGLQDVFDGGVARGTIINNGTERVESGGVALHVTLAALPSSYLDYVDVRDGGLVSGIVLGGGSLNIESGGTVEAIHALGDDPFIDVQGGTLSGGKLFNGSLTQVSGSVSDLSATDATIGVEGGSFASGILGAHTDLFLAAGTADAVQIDNFGVLIVDGGSARNTVVAAGGVLQVRSSAAVVTGTTVEFGGVLQIAASGPSVSDTVLIPGGTIDLYRLGFDGTTEAMFAAGSGALTVTEDGHQVSVQLAGSYQVPKFQVLADRTGGTMVTVAPNGTTSAPVISAGVSSSGLFVNSTGTLTVLTGGTATGTMLQDFGVQRLSGGVARATTVTGHGVEAVDGGTASGTVVSSGEQIVRSGGLAMATQVLSGGEAIVMAGGSATAAVVSGGILAVAGVVNGGTLRGTGLALVEAGGTLSGFAAVHGFVSVGSGGVASDIVLRDASLGNEGVVNGGTIGMGGTLVGYATASGVGSMVTTVEQGVTVSFGGTILVQPGASLPTDTYLLGGTIDLPDVEYLGRTLASFDSSTDRLAVIEGQTTVTLQLAGSYTGMKFELHKDGIGRRQGTYVVAEAKSEAFAHESLPAAAATMGSAALAAAADAPAMTNAARPAYGAAGGRAATFDFAAHGMLTATHVR